MSIDTREQRLQRAGQADPTADVLLEVLAVQRAQTAALERIADSLERLHPCRWEMAPGGGAYCVPCSAQAGDYVTWPCPRQLAKEGADR